MRVSRFAFGLVLVITGLVFLASNLGYMSLTPGGLVSALLDLIGRFLTILGRHWPVALIVIGLFFFTGMQRYLRVLILVLLVAAAVLAVTSAPGITGVEEYDLAQELEEGVESAAVSIDFAAGKLRISSATAQLVEADFTVPSGWRAQLNYDRAGRRGEVEIKVEGERELSWNWLSRDRNIVEGDVSLNGSVPLDLELSVAAADARIDLRDNHLRRLDLDAGAARVDLIVGQLEEEVSIIINGGASDLNLEVPEGYGLSVQLKGALLNHNLKAEGLNEVDADKGTWQTPSFDSATRRINIEVTAGVGDFTLKRR